MVRDQRRLAAIVSADVAGYSRLMGLDDSGTLAALKTHRRELIDPKIAEYGGRIVKTTGDGLLLEFPSVVDAVRCAVDVQRGMAERNTGVVAERRLDFRIGINVGDIIIDGDDIYGDGVNVAARLQALAEPGEICASKVVRDQVVDKLSFAFEELGAQRVKNIARPVEVYRVELGGAMPDLASHGHLRWLRLARSRKWQLVGAGVVAVAIAGVLAWWMPRFFNPAATPNPPAMSIAVAPLEAPKGDAEAARFADAFTRDLVSTLSRLEGTVGRLHVVAVQGDSTSEVIDPSALGRRFNARYVLAGNVNRNGEGNSVNLQLVNAATGGQVWDARTTVQNSDVSGQSSVPLRNLARQLRTAVISAEIRRVLAQPLSTLNATELVLRAGALSRQDPSLAGQLEARKLVDKALQLDPNLVSALCTRINLNSGLDSLDPKGDHSRLVREIDEDAARAVSLDPTSAHAWGWRGFALQLREQWEAALEANATAIKLDPDEPDYWVDRAVVLNLTGRPAEALALANRALATDVSGGAAFRPESEGCRAYLLLGQAEQAAAMCEKALAIDDDWYVRALLVAAYANQGDTEKSAVAKAELLKTQPRITVDQVKASDRSSHPEFIKLTEKYLYGALRKAGIPEK
ncbi:MAG TPA: adenylate/guanylate cyclase domain-containing protein [Bryobacteraceae bacterium]|nr:adenylate/guanylate cyclase domain-containing protein [Bryobacteraceae bacterium]